MIKIHLIIEYSNISVVFPCSFVSDVRLVFTFCEPVKRRMIASGKPCYCSLTRKGTDGAANYSSPS